MVSQTLTLPSGAVLASERPGAFGEGLRTPNLEEVDRWVWLAYDQLNVAFLESLDASERLGVVLIESAEKAQRRPYHQQKLGVLLSNQRHFALELQALGVSVLYLLTRSSYTDILRPLVKTLGCLETFVAAERELRLEVEPLSTEGVLVVHPHPGWLTPRDWFTQSVGHEPPFRMDAFYRTVRQSTGWLMESGKPLGGKYSFDAENRRPWKGEPACPEPPIHANDAVDEEVERMVRQHYGHHPGKVDLASLPTTAQAVEVAVDFAMEVLPHFGPFEDAMSEQSRGLFHSRLATLLNLHRLMPSQLVERVLASKAPHNSVEGFLRQLIWREYVHHIHDVTDGFRTLEVDRQPAHRGARWDGFGEEDEEHHPNHLGQNNPLPRAYWGEASGLRCLDASVESVMEEGWTHHIPRLMVLSNIANLLDVDPRELTDWFHVAFIDAYDWVVEPNVLGMGTFSLGTAMMTKPYVAGAAYINKMSDHCGSCAFHPKKTCPMTRLYWAYLSRHAPLFSGNHRMAIAMKNVSRRAEEEKAKDIAAFEAVGAALRTGQELRPMDNADLRTWS